MSEDDDEFGEVLALWQNENLTPWGQLRYETSRTNIARHFDGEKKHILDVGGGDGMDAIYYAKMGHSVTLTDCSVTMLTEAKKMAEGQGIDEQLALIQTEPDSLLNNLNGHSFDLILCHMMIEFVPDPQALINKLSLLLIQGGLISILDTNRFSDVYMRAIQLNDLPGALDAVGKQEYFHPWVKRITPRFSADDFIDLLAENGCSVVGHYGVLNICGYLPNEPKFIPEYYHQLKELEDQLSGRYPYYLLARYFQVIGRKNQTS